MAIPTYTREQLLTLLSTKLADQSTITALEHRDLETAIVNAIYGQIGDIKEISCDTTYIANNFKTGTGLPDEGLGLPSGERYGWAICNGKNGTVDKRGNVSIGYDPSSYATLASTQSGGPNPPYKQGGLKTVTLSVTEIPAHFHHTPNSIFKSFVALGSDYGNNSTTGVSGDNTGGGNELAIMNLATNYTTPNGAALEKTIGGGQSHENMQPYIVTLFIQRIPTT